MPERPEIRTERAVVEELVDLLKEYGPSIVKLADHFDALKKSGITDRAAHEVKQRQVHASGDAAGQIIDLLGTALKTKVRNYTRRSR